MRRLRQSIKKIDQKKTQYNIDKETAQISVLSSGNISKYKFLSEKAMLEKADVIKRFEYSPLGKKIKSTNYYYRKTV